VKSGMWIVDTGHGREEVQKVVNDSIRPRWPMRKITKPPSAARGAPIDRGSVSLGYRTRLTIYKFGDEVSPFWWLGEGTSPDTVHCWVWGPGVLILYCKIYWVLGFCSCTVRFIGFWGVAPVLSDLLGSGVLLLHCKIYWVLADVAMELVQSCIQHARGTCQG
jgi:hypothetical protein